MNQPIFGAKKVAQKAVKAASEPVETLRSQVAKPIMEEFGQEFASLFGASKLKSPKEHTLAQDELANLRSEQKLNEEKQKDEQKSQETIAFVKSEYKSYSDKFNQEQHKLKQEVVELQSEIAGLAKSEGIDTKVHLQNSGTRIGAIDIKFFTSIVRMLRLKSEESKSAKELQSQRQNSKHTTGMMAWVSGKQMQVHEQGTLTLQG